MRFIGNKENILKIIYQIMVDKEIKGKTFFDFFSGTTSVAKYFKKLNYQIFSSDLLYFSYVLQRAYIVNNDIPLFKKVLPEIKIQTNLLFSTPLELVIEFLDQIEGVKGFIYNNYTPEGTKNLKIPRMFFSNENGEKIDAIRQKIEFWKEKQLINENEYYILLACLLETVPFYANITGVYAAFQKKWDVRATKKLKLRGIEIISNEKTNSAYNINSIEPTSTIKADIFYLDPPYNHRQYAPNYHLLETIAKYDNPEIRGVAGLRNYEMQKSNFCNAKTGIKELSAIAKNANCKFLIMSYNTEGIMPKNKIVETLSQFGKVDVVEFKYLRYKSNNNGEAKDKKFINEQLFILRK